MPFAEVLRYHQSKHLLLDPFPKKHLKYSQPSAEVLRYQQSKHLLLDDREIVGHFVSVAPVAAVVSTSVTQSAQLSKLSQHPSSINDIH